MSQEAIIAEVQSHGAQYVCVTGGEPLLQKEVFELMRKLCDLGLKVSCETSGSIDCTNVDARVKKIIDVKTPDSGEQSSFLPVNLAFRDEMTEYKFVICSEDDFAWSEAFSRENDLFTRSNVLYSPAFRRVDENWLAKKILSEKSPARLQLQLHKYIWSPHSRGV